MQIPKNKPERDKKYLKAISNYGCAVCRQGAVPHHLIGYGGSMGGKVSDYLVFPLCNKHHSATSVDGVHKDVYEWEKRYGNQIRYVKRTLNWAVADGHISDGKWQKAYEQCEDLQMRFRKKYDTRK